MESAAPHTPRGAPSTSERSPGRSPSWLPRARARLHRNPSRNLRNQNGQASAPGGGASAPNKEPETGAWLSDRYGSGESEKGKGLRTVWRLDGAQGPGPRRRQNTPWGLERGQCPAWPPTHQRLARLAGQPKPRAAQGGPGPPLRLARLWLSSAPPRVLPTQGHLALHRSQNKLQLIPVPKPLLFTRQTCKQVAETRQCLSPQLQALCLSLSPLPSPLSLLLTSPGSPILTPSKKNSTCHGPRTALEHGSAPHPGLLRQARPVGTSLSLCVPCPARASHPQACGSLLSTQKPWGCGDHARWARGNGGLAWERVGSRTLGDSHTGPPAKLLHRDSLLFCAFPVERPYTWRQQHTEAEGRHAAARDCQAGEGAPGRWFPRPLNRLMSWGLISPGSGDRPCPPPRKQAQR